MHPFVSESVAVLERTPRVMAALLDGAPEAWTETRESEGSFSPRDVLGHLIHGEDTDWVPRLRLILEKGDSEPFAGTKLAPPLVERKMPPPCVPT